MSVFNTIEQNISTVIENRLSNGIFEWSLPRLSGVTSWLFNKIEEDLHQGKNVVYASNLSFSDTKNIIRNSPKLLNAFENKRLFLVNENNFHNLKGHTIHRIYGDCLLYWSSRNKFEFIKSYYPVMPEDDRYILILNTTSGELIHGRN